MFICSARRPSSKALLFASAASVVAVLAMTSSAAAQQSTVAGASEARAPITSGPLMDSRAEITGLTYLNNNTLPTGYRYYSDPADTSGSLVAGLSGIDYDPRTGRFVTVRDNWMFGAGAAGQGGFPNLFDLTARPVEGSPGYTLEISGVRSLNGDGRAVMDTLEGVRFDPAGQGLWFISEDRGSIFHWMPDDSRTEIRLPDSIVRASGNAGLEGLALTPSGGLWVAREGTMPGDAANISRISQVDREGRLLSQFAYQRDAMAGNGVSEMIALSETSFLVMERAWDGTGANANPQGVSHNSVRVYRIDLAGATDVNGLVGVPSDGSVMMLAKTLVFDSASLAGTLNTYDTKVDNIEGMTFGPRLANGHATMVMVSDNNNSRSQRKTQFLVFRVDSPIPEVQLWDGEGPMADGNSGGSGVWRAKPDVENWTRTGGWVNDRWAGRTAQFGGKAGIVTIDASDGPVSAGSLLFRTDGYRIEGGALTLAGTVGFDVGEPMQGDRGTGMTATIAAALTGDGGLQKTGQGTLRLTGSSDFAGGTLVSGGTLLVQGTIGGRVDVASGAVLGGSGTIGTAAQAGDLNIASGGVLDPGSGIGTLNVAGNVTFADGGIYRAQVSATGASDLLNATGIATIGSGAVVAVNALDRTENGFDYASPTRYRIVAAAGGVIGTFGSVTENFAYLNAALGYDRTGVYLTLTRAGTTADSETGPRPDNPIIATDITIASAADLRNGSILLGGGRLVSTTNIESGQSLRIAPEGGTIAPQAGTMLTLSGDIGGRGILTKSGAGTLRLTGTNAANGDVLVQNGLLRVDGTLTGGTVTVTDGGSLGGTGRLGAVRIGAGGVLAPGASIGALEAISYAFDAGSVYRVEVDPTGRSDLLRTTGAVTIDGGARVTVTPQDTTEDGSTYAVSTRYTIITAQGGVSGEFGSVSDTFAYLAPTLSYDDNTVYLTLDRVKTGGGVIAFSDVVSTPNRKAAASAVESLGAGNPVYEAALYLPDGYPEGAFEQLSGEIHSAVGTALIDMASQSRRAMMERTRAPLGGVERRLQGSAAVSDGRTGVWLNGLGAWNRYSADGNGNRLTADSSGFMGGVDTAVGDTGRIGIAAGWTRMDLRTGMTGTDTGQADSYHFGAFGGAMVRGFGLRAGASYSWSDISTTRSVIFPRFDETLRGDYSGSTFQVFTEAGRRLEVGRMTVEPYVGVAHVRFDADVVEVGGDAALFAAGDAATQTFTTAGLRLERGFTVGGMPGQLSGEAAWQHGFGDRAAVRRLRIAGGGGFDVASTTLAEDSALLDLSLGIALSERVAVSAGYNGNLGSGQTNHSVNARMSMRF